MSDQRRVWVAYALLLLLALGFRLLVARRFANDQPDDGKVYAQIARNVLEQHVYSHESQPPYVPSIIRLPGYPLFLTSIYYVFGHGNNTAVRIVQAVIDTATCLLIALVAFQWTTDEELKRTTSLAALALAAICPFTAIYSGTILTEVPTSFLAVALCLAATFAFKATNRKPAFIWWAIAGAIAGIAVLFRPDSGLFAAAIGLTIILSGALTARKDTSLASEPNVGKRKLFRRLLSSGYLAAVFSVAFCLILVPWTIRNRRVFHVFQPLSPAHGEMPGEFVPRGYLMWLRTWLDDERYIGPVLWSLDTSPIKIDDFPDHAFDTEQERDRVAALLNKYNHPNDETTPQAEEAPQTVTKDGSQASETPEPSPSDEEADQGSEEGKQGDEEDQQGDEEDSPEADQAGSQNVEMTPDIDAQFAQLAHERIARAPLRYYLVVPAKRAVSLWFDTHSQYYPFDGELLPLEDLDYEIHQQYWLPLFAALTWIYTILGAVGGWLLWRSGTIAAKRWVLLAGLIIFLRLAFFSSLENPEPRYTVEIFPFLAILGGIALGRIVGLLRNLRMSSASN